MKRMTWIAVALASGALIANAQEVQRFQATMNLGGDANRGKCTIEVVVDGTVEVEIRGDQGFMRNLAGQQPSWRRFQCNGVMPRNPVGFRFAGVDGRGRQQLIRDPQQGGVAVVRIDDPQNGSEGYTFDLFWGGGEGGPGYPGGGYPPGNGGGFPGGGNNGPRPGDRYTTEQAVRACQDAVRQQASDRFRTNNINFMRTSIDDQPGRNDWVVGSMRVQRRDGRDEVFRFSCSADFRNGRIRTAQIDDNGGPGAGYPGGGGGSNGNSIQACQSSVEQRLQRDGYRRIEFRSINADDRPGRNGWIVGNVIANRDGRPDQLDFSCSVDRGGVVRSVDVNRR